MPYGLVNDADYLKPPTKSKTSITATNPNDRYGSVSTYPSTDPNDRYGPVPPKVQSWTSPTVVPPNLNYSTQYQGSPSYGDTWASGTYGQNAGNIIGGQTPGSGEGLGDPGTGWMSGIKPDAARMLFENPDAFLRQIMSRMGLDPDAAIGALQLASPMARNMNELAMIMLGADPEYGAGSWDQTGNWMANFLSNQMSPGGRYVDFNAGMQNLLSAITAGSDQLSPLGSILGIDDPAGQSQAFNSLATALAGTSLHPLWARAFQDELGRQGDAYISKNATTTSMDPYNVWLGSRGF